GVLPFLNLDESTADPTLTLTVTALLQAGMTAVGPAKVVSPAVPPKNWTGTGTPSEIQSAFKDTNCRAVLVGMFRTTSGGIRVSLRLAQRDTDASQNWTVEPSSVQEVTHGLAAKHFGASVYHLLDKP